MRLSAEENEGLRRVTPDLVANYLERTGWKRTGVREGFASKWSKTTDRSGEPYEILLPLDPTFDDFVERMADLLAVVATAEGRPVQRVYQAFVTSTCDRFRARILGEEVADGSIPFIAGALAFQGVKEMFIAAALSSKEPRTVHPSVSKDVAATLLKSARLSQTEHGSYVINVTLKLPPESAQQALPGTPPTEPQPRRILRTLAKGLGATHDAAIEQTEEAFRSRIVDGVSANLCSALARFGAHDWFRGVDFEWDWSWSVAVPEVPRRVSFSPQAIRNVAEAGEILRAEAPKAGYQLVGRVKHLEHAGEVEGYVEVIETAGGRSHRVRLFLRGPDHDLAHQAYKTRDLVTCVGELVRHGKKAALLNPQGFMLVPKPQG